MSCSVLTIFTVLMVLPELINGDPRATGRASPYGMYVWREGWDPNVGCTEQDFLDWTSARCFSHTWNTLDKRQWLWDTCNTGGREIDTLFIYDMDTSLPSRDCYHSGVVYIRDTLREGRAQVSGLIVYALFSEGDEGVSEQFLVSHVAWYNENCALDSGEIINGVAVNNEAYDAAWTEERMLTYLDNLYNVRMEADKQQPIGSLLVHYSIGWSWGTDTSGEEIIVHWHGVSKPIIQHFIDIFHSLDVQIAFVTSDAMEERMRVAHWDYGQATGKKLWTNVYINKAYPCQTTFFPFPVDHPSCSSWSHAYENESAMFQETDALETRLPGATIVLHHFRGAYSSGGYPGWPLHLGQTHTVCA